MEMFFIFLSLRLIPIFPQTATCKLRNCMRRLTVTTNQRLRSKKIINKILTLQSGPGMPLPLWKSLNDAKQEILSDSCFDLVSSIDHFLCLKHKKLEMSWGHTDVDMLCSQGDLQIWLLEKLTTPPQKCEILSTGWRLGAIVMRSSWMNGALMMMTTLTLCGTQVIWSLGLC